MKTSFVSHFSKIITNSCIINLQRAEVYLAHSFRGLFRHGSLDDACEPVPRRKDTCWRKQIPLPPGQKVSKGERGKTWSFAPSTGTHLLDRWPPPTGPHLFMFPTPLQQLLDLGIKLLSRGSGDAHKICTKWVAFISDDGISMFAMQLRGCVSGGGLGSCLERTEENCDTRRKINKRKTLESVV